MMIRLKNKVELVRDRVKGIVEYLRTGSIYDVTVAHADRADRHQRTLQWLRAEDVMEQGTFLEVMPFFGYRRSYSLSGTTKATFISSAEAPTGIRS